jgi:hypothetical protein
MLAATRYAQEGSTMSTPAGWYDDPESPGQQRFWDGIQWTEHRQPAAAVPPPPRPDAQPSTMHAAAPQKKSHTTRNVLLAVVGVFVLLVGGCTVAVIVSAGSAINEAANEATPPDSTPQDDKTPADGNSPTPANTAGEGTVSQQNALESAESYLAFSAFSEAGLIDQLSSKAGEGYPKADAVWAVKHLDVDWNAQAVKSAKSYLKFTSFSRSGLIEQLSSSAGEQFTKAQATYAANEVGL